MQCERVSKSIALLERKTGLERLANGAESLRLNTEHVNCGTEWHSRGSR